LPAYAAPHPATGNLTGSRFVPHQLTDVTLVAAGATWKYLDDGSNQGTAWKDVTFDDSGWAAGPAQLGYGDGDEATVVSFGPDANNKYVTTYFRYSFNISDPSIYQSLSLQIMRDDGAIVYLNGSQVFSSNMPAGPITYTTPASSTVGSANESQFVGADISPGHLVTGTNIIAVEIHQVSGSSSDISFDLILSGITTASICGPADVRFAVIGDFGEAGPVEEDVANQVKSWNPEFIITVGDNNYDNGEAATIDANVGQSYHEFIGNYSGSYGSGAVSNNFYPTLGNHDWITKSGTPPLPQPYLDYFTLPGNERYYNFIRGPIEFFALDSDPNEPDGRTISSTQAIWLQTQLGASTAPWKLVYFHHAPYSSARHGPDTTMQWPFQDWGATAVLAGHDHTYERIVLNDFPYFVNGIGGKENLYSFNTPITGSVVRYNDDNGAMLVEATEDCLSFQLITRAGAIIDTYTIDNRAPVLSVQKTVDDSTPAPGQMITYTVGVSNSGSASATNVTISDTLPLSLTLAGPVTVTGSTAKIGPPPALANQLTITAGQQITLTIPVTVSANLVDSSQFTNTASVTSAEVTHPLSSSVTATVQTPILSISKWVDDATPAPGQVITYTVIVNNSGSANATNVTISDTLPLSLTLAGPVTVTGSAGNVGPPPALASQLTITAGQQVTVTVPVSLSQSFGPGTTLLTNTATVTSAKQPQPIAGNQIITIFVQPVDESPPQKAYLPTIFKD